MANAAQGTIIDLRTLSQHHESSPPGSICIPAGEPGMLGLLFHFREGFEADLIARCVDKGLALPLLLLCDVGVVSSVAATKLAAAGLDADLRVISGGYEAWQMESSLPCGESQAPPSSDLDAHLGEDLELVTFSLWEEDKGEHPCEPVLHLDLSEDVEPEELGIEVEDPDEVADDDLDVEPQLEAGETRAAAARPAANSRDLDLAELEDAQGRQAATNARRPTACVACGH